MHTPSNTQKEDTTSSQSRGRVRRKEVARLVKKVAPAIFTSTMHTHTYCLNESIFAPQRSLVWYSKTWIGCSQSWEPMASSALGNYRASKSFVMEMPARRLSGQTTRL